MLYNCAMPCFQSSFGFYSTLLPYDRSRLNMMKRMYHFEGFLYLYQLTMMLLIYYTSKGQIFAPRMQTICVKLHIGIHQKARHTLLVKIE